MMYPLSPFEEAVFDIETDGLLDTTTKGHCLVIIDAITEQVLRFRPHEFEEGCRFLSQCKIKVAHNGIKFDVPAIKKIHGIDMEFDPYLMDTLVLARLIYSNIKDLDQKWRHRWGLPGKLFGSHSLKAWGYRLGVHKDDFGETSDWRTFSEEMLDYCEQDVWVTVALWRKLKEKAYSPEAIRLEHDIAWCMAKQERNGFKFDEAKAMSLYAVLAAERNEVEQQMMQRFGSWYVNKGEVIPAKSINYKDRTKSSRVAGAPFTKIELVTFNPGSRQHIARVLKARGWKPKEFTESGQPKIDETVLNKLPWPEAKVLARYFMLQKRLGQLAEGDQAWLKQLRNGAIHGSVNPNGAVTGRATHSFPNVAQVPSCGSEFGAECRELFTVPQGWVLMGSDASGLELRCLGHFMARWDGGAYIDVILNGDIHTANQKAAGLSARDQAKTFIYAFLYGAGDVKIGSIVDPNASEAKQRAIGKKLKDKFLRNTPALRFLRDAVSKAAARGYLIGLDGRKVYVRSEHAALNTLLQSAGALVCKHWVVTVERMCREAGLKHGWDGDFALCAWVHDEVQIACRTQAIAEQIGQICKAAMVVTQKHFDFRCPLDAEYAIGASWKDTH